MYTKHIREPLIVKVKVSNYLSTLVQKRTTYRGTHVGAFFFNLEAHSGCTVIRSGITVAFHMPDDLGDRIKCSIVLWNSAMVEAMQHMRWHVLVADRSCQYFA